MDAKTDTDSPRLPRPRRGRRSGPRPRPLRRRRAAAEPGLRLFRALAARLRPHRRASIPPARQSVPGVIAVLTAQDMDGHRQYFAASAAAGPQRHQAHRHPPAGARQRPRHAYRRAGGHGGRRARARGAGRRRIRPCRIRAAHAGDRRARGARTGAPQFWPEAPNNLAVDWPGPAADPDCQCRRGRAPVRFGQARRAHRGNEPAPLRRLDGAARRHRELRCRARHLHAAHLLAERRHHAREHSRHHELAEGETARHHRRRRRRVRAEDRRPIRNTWRS